MKTFEIQNIYTGLVGIKTKKLPIKLAFVLSRNMKKLEEVVQDVDENRQKLLNQYGEKDDDGNLVVADDGNVKIMDANNFVAEMSEVMETEVDITLDKVSRSDIEKCDQDGYDKLTLEEVGAMECMIEEELES